MLSDLLVAVSACVLLIIDSGDAEGDEAASDPAADEAKNEAEDPGEGSLLFSHVGDTGVTAMLA